MKTLLLSLLAVVILNGCSIDQSTSKGKKTEYREVFSLQDLENLPLNPHSLEEDESWENVIKHFDVMDRTKKALYTKSGMTRDQNVINQYLKTHGQDVILARKINDGLWQVRIWTDGDAQIVGLIKQDSKKK